MAKRMAIVVNSSPLIALTCIDKIGLLKDLFHDIYIPQEVYQEIVINGKNILVESSIHKYGYIVKRVNNQRSIDLLTEILDKGEAEVLTLANELSIKNVLIDELRGRRIAEKQELSVIGSLGILLLAKQKKLIPNLKSCIELMQSNNIRISEKLKIAILTEAREI